MVSRLDSNPDPATSTTALDVWSNTLPSVPQIQTYYRMFMNPSYRHSRSMYMSISRDGAHTQNYKSYNY